MRKLGLLAMLVAALVMVGCEKEKKAAKDDKKADAGHSHDHGPKGEVMFAINDNGIELHAEYLFDKNTNKCTVAFCDDHGHKAAAVKIDKIEIVYDKDRYLLTAVDPKDGKASEYVSEANADLAVIAKNSPSLEVTIGDKTAKAKLPKPH